MKNIKKSNILPKTVCSYAFLPENALFLDIETTGLSAVRSHLYLIGTAYIKNNELKIEQFFAESANEEPQIIAAFEKMRQPFDTIITFHGNRFDLPFIEKRKKSLRLAPMDAPKNNMDLYELAHCYRHIFGLENYQLKTLEQFIGLQRADRYTGGELIKVYQSYVKQPNDELLSLLLRHNEDDLTGMAHLLSLSSFSSFFEGRFTPAGCQLSSYRKLDGTDAKELAITCRLDAVLPAAVSCKNNHYYLHAEKDSAFFQIPLFEGTLKYFYPNYKDYYYLPKEDTALHKSVACYVDPAYRQKAKAANCYMKKTGAFLPQYEEIITPALYTDYKAPVSYFEWKEADADNRTIQKQYCMHILDILKRGL